ncbi:MAG: DNA polymerase III subunit beta [Oscillospiraceae bacterium]|nr:DNA polymerase III subunit beta [Oscillospiraceae bacterium]
MRFSCEKAILLNAINTASRAVSPKSSIPALEGLLLQADSRLTISGYNMQTGIRTAVDASVTEDGCLAVNARLFGDMVRRLPDDVVSFSCDSSLNITLICGDASYNMTAIPADDYPDLPEVEDEYSVSINQRLLKTMIGETSFAVSTNEARPVHTGSLFEIEEQSLTVVSVDGFRLALRREKLENSGSGAFRFVAPGSALNEVEKICGDADDPASITLGSRHLLFEVGPTQLICRRLEGEFLDYRAAIPRTNPIILTADSKSLMASIDRVSVVISDKQKSPVRCVFELDKATLSAKTASGEARDVCRVEGDGNGLEIGFNNRYLMDALKYAPADKVRLELNTGISPCIIAPVEGEENFLYMVLPVRLKNS